MLIILLMLFAFVSNACNSLAASYSQSHIFLSLRNIAYNLLPCGITFAGLLCNTTNCKLKILHTHDCCWINERSHILCIRKICIPPGLALLFRVRMLHCKVEQSAHQLEMVAGLFGGDFRHKMEFSCDGALSLHVCPHRANYGFYELVVAPSLLLGNVSSLGRRCLALSTATRGRLCRGSFGRRRSLGLAFGLSFGFGFGCSFCFPFAFSLGFAFGLTFGMQCFCYFLCSLAFSPLKCSLLSVALGSQKGNHRHFTHEAGAVCEDSMHEAIISVLNTGVLDCTIC